MREKDGEENRGEGKKKKGKGRAYAKSDMGVNIMSSLFLLAAPDMYTSRRLGGSLRPF